MNGAMAKSISANTKMESNRVMEYIEIMTALYILAIGKMANNMDKEQ